jgi:hypothetical protein
MHSEALVHLQNHPSGLHALVLGLKRETRNGMEMKIREEEITTSEIVTLPY